MESINQRANIESFSSSDRLIKKKKAILINETSVYREYVILKEMALTDNGYFDLVQIPNLRIYAGDLLRSIRLKLNVTQRGFSKKFSLSKLALYQWEHNRSAMPLSILVRIAKSFGIKKEKIYRLIKEKKILIKKGTNLPIRYGEILIALPFISFTGKRHIILKQKGKKYINKISRLFNIKIQYRTNKQFVINSLDIANFLSTFFEIKKRLKINLPLTKIVKNWYDLRVDLRKAVICPLIQTDGCGILDKRKNSKVIIFKNLSNTLHNILVDAFYFSFDGFLPSSYMLKDNSVSQRHSLCYITRYGGIIFQPVYNDLIRLCKNFKTSIYHAQSLEDYKKEPKPNLNYLCNANQLEKEIAFRIWASTEGAIIVTRIGNFVTPKLQISCSNKKLLFQLQKIAKEIGLHFTIRKEKSRGYKCLYSMSISCALSFLKLGGFIAGVKISKSSKYYEGIDKQDLLYATLEYMYKERKNPSLKSLPITNAHKLIRKIAENKQFKSLNYYINYFSRNDKIRKCLNY